MKAQTVQSADVDPVLKDNEVSPSFVTRRETERMLEKDLDSRGKDGWKGPRDSSEALVCDRIIVSKRETRREDGFAGE